MENEREVLRHWVLNAERRHLSQKLAQLMSVSETQLYGVQLVEWAREVRRVQMRLQALENK